MFWIICSSANYLDFKWKLCYEERNLKETSCILSCWTEVWVWLAQCSKWAWFSLLRVGEIPWWCSLIWTLSFCVILKIGHFCKQFLLPFLFLKDYTWKGLNASAETISTRNLPGRDLNIQIILDILVTLHNVIDK